jgi:hypothetical protein
MAIEIVTPKKVCQVFLCNRLSICLEGLPSRGLQWMKGDVASVPFGRVLDALHREEPPRTGIPIHDSGVLRQNWNVFESKDLAGARGASKSRSIGTLSGCSEGAELGYSSRV